MSELSILLRCSRHEIAGLGGEMTEQTLASLCPSILFPYARENIDSLITKGTFLR